MYRDYRGYLKDKLAERIARNPKYSLRSFAASMDILASHLSQVFSGKRNLSAEKAYSVAEKLRLGKEETEFFVALVRFELASAPAERAALATRLESFEQAGQVTDLSVDVFKAIAEWYHLPILEMVALRASEYTPAALAERLGIAPVEAERAIERLLRLELLEKTETGYRKAHSNLVFKSPVPNQALRHFHKQMLERASSALETQRPADRYVGSETFAVDPALVPGAAKIVEKFRRELVEYFDSTKNEKTEIYHLGVQMFRVTKEQK